MEQQNIVVTGASNGVGYQSARELALAGHRVFALARSADKLSALESEVRATGGTLIPVTMDLTDASSRAAACREITGQAKHIDVLVHNAGHLVKKPFAELAEQDWLTIFQVNVFGVAEMTKLLLPALRGGSHVVHISSMGGVQGSVKFPGLSAYSAAKSALATLAECLAEELRSDGVTVNCLALGSVETAMFAKAFPGQKAALQAGDAARFISYFALNGHRYFNGKVLPVSSATP